jgi:hypothetical protein
MSIATSQQADLPREKALVDVAKVIVTAGLTLGSVMLSAFGFLERAVGLERLATDRRFILAALLPGGAALAFLASARALGAAYDASVPPRSVSSVRRAGLRFIDLGGSFGLIAVVMACLVAVGTMLATALAFDLKAPVLGALLGGVAFIVALSGMLARASVGRQRMDLALAGLIVALMVADLILSGFVAG